MRLNWWFLWHPTLATYITASLGPKLKQRLFLTIQTLYYHNSETAQVTFQNLTVSMQAMMFVVLLL